MQFNWLLSKRSVPRPARLEAIFISIAAGEPMQSVAETRAIAQSGLDGDRYASKTGHWQATDACELTLISTDDLRRATKGQSEVVSDTLKRGGHRRNLVISGVRSRQLEGRTFRIGNALLRYHKPRPPCAYLDQIEGMGLCRALGRCSGICLKVLESGEFKVGDILEWVT